MATQKQSTNRFTLKGGAYVDIRELIDLRYAARDFRTPEANKTRNPLSGLLSSNYKGRGIDFAEVRVYQPGDDVRTIDWRVTARTQTPHTKMFQEEKERPVLILVDQSSSMFFGSRHSFKSVLAAQAAALIAWTALERGDRIGGIVFAEKGHRQVRPRRSKSSVLRLLHEIHDYNRALSRQATDAGASYLTEALQNVRRVAKHGSTIFLISDFQSFDYAACQIHLRQLGRHNDVVGVHVSDPMEVALPSPDLYTITNGTTRVRINTSIQRHRRAYENEFETNLSRVRDEFARIRSPLVTISTSQSGVSALAGRFGEASI
ncbi:MAG: DUF58 domain-containing protein [Proteobacteria bacterium]|nr:DUF58 domain-containing protein [Pseudomonadota bacterium]